jgi:hypothetical protein
MTGVLIFYSAIALGCLIIAFFLWLQKDLDEFKRQIEEDDDD